MHETEMDVTEVKLDTRDRDKRGNGTLNRENERGRGLQRITGNTVIQRLVREVGSTRERIVSGSQLLGISEIEGVNEIARLYTI